MYFGSDVVRIGWGDQTTSEPRHPHEIIEFTFRRQDGISSKASELYEKGHSIADVAAMVDVPASSLFEAMKNQKIRTRPLKTARRTNPPFGYAWLSGKIVINPIEYKTVQLILELAKMGRRPHQIGKYLNEKMIKPRRGKKWFARTIIDIIRRENK